MKHTNMEQLNMFENILPFKLFRKNDPSTSKEAASSAQIGRTRAFVLNIVEEAGPRGTTTKEMTRNHPNIPTSSISSRPNELEKLGLVFYLGDKRDKARVIRHIKYK